MVHDMHELFEVHEQKAHRLSPMDALIALRPHLLMPKRKSTKICAVVCLAFRFVGILGR